MCVSALLAWVANHPLILLLPIVGIVALIWWKVHKSNQRRAAERAWREKLLYNGVDDCDLMTGAEFEQRIALSLEALGAQIEEVGGGGRDGGADVVAMRDDSTRIVIQCKRWDGQVGWDAVKEINAARALLGAHRAAVATNRTLSPYGMRRAYELGVEVWDRAYLINLFSRAAPGLAPELPRPVRRGLMVEPPSHEARGIALDPQSPTPAEDLSGSGASPQLSPDGKWWWTGTERVSITATQSNREAAAEDVAKVGSDLQERALEVEARQSSDALTLQVLRLLQDPKRRCKGPRGERR